MFKHFFSSFKVMKYLCFRFLRTRIFVPPGARIVTLQDFFLSLVATHGHVFYMIKNMFTKSRVSANVYSILSHCFKINLQS